MEVVDMREPGSKYMFEIAKHILNATDVTLVEERVKDYGDPKICFRILSEMWTSYTGHPITPNDVAMMMVLLKVVRNKHRVKLDNLIDICGYAALAGELTLADDPSYVPPPPPPPIDEPEEAEVYIDVDPDLFNCTCEDKHRVGSDWKPTPGEIIEVSNTGAADTWVKARFIEMEDRRYVCSVNLGVHLRLTWQYARKLQEQVKESEDKPFDTDRKPEPGDTCEPLKYFL